MDNGDLRVHRSGGVALELGGQEERRLDIFLERGAAVHHVDVTDHRNRHAQVATCTPSTAELAPPTLPQLCVVQQGQRWEG